jgi:hypothetical protein
MAGDYDTYPAVDDDLLFPPELRTAMAKYPELLAMAAAAGKPGVDLYTYLMTNIYEANEQPFVKGPSDLRVTPVANALTVNVDPGGSIAGRDRYYMGTAKQISVPQPSTGGKWYALSILRVWDTNVSVNSVTRSFVLDDLAITDAGSATPTDAPNSVVAAATGLANSYGSTTTGHKQVLALVYSRAGTTALGVIDLRLFRTGLGNYEVPGWAALSFHGYRVNNGAIFEVAKYVLSGVTNAAHRSSVWVKSNGTLFPIIGTAMMVEGAVDVPQTATIVSEITTSVRLYTNLSFYGSLVSRMNVQMSSNVTVVYAYVSGASWQPWDSDWISFTPVLYQMSAGGSGIQCRYRYHSGRVVAQYTVTTNGVNTGSLMIGLPVTAQVYPTAAIPMANFLMNSGGNRYILFTDLDNANRMIFRYQPISQQPAAFLTNTAPLSLGSTAVVTLTGQIEYDIS